MQRQLKYIDLRPTRPGPLLNAFWNPAQISLTGLRLRRALLAQVLNIGPTYSEREWIELRLFELRRARPAVAG